MKPLVKDFRFSKFRKTSKNIFSKTVLSNVMKINRDDNNILHHMAAGNFHDQRSQNFQKTTFPHLCDAFNANYCEENCD
jgi:hypothetical protein